MHEFEGDERRVHLELSKVAFANIRELVRSDGTLIPFEELPPEVAAAVASMEITEIITRGGDGDVQIKRTVKVELADKVKSLKRLGQSLGLFANQVEGEVEGPEIVTGADTPGATE